MIRNSTQITQNDPVGVKRFTLPKP